MKNLWIYVAITLIVTALCLTYLTWWTVILLCLWCVRLFLFRHRTVLMISAILAFILVFLYQTRQRVSQIDTTQMRVVITIFADKIKVNGDSLTAEGMLQNERIHLKRKIATEQEQQFWKNTVDNITVKANVTYSKPPIATNPYQFDYRRYLADYNSIFMQVTLENFTILNMQRNIIAYIHRGLLLELPQSIHLFADSLIFSKHNDELSEPFQLLGVLYLVSASGIHITWSLAYFKKLGIFLHLRREWIDKLSYMLAVFLWYLGFGSIGVTKACVLFLSRRVGTKCDRLAWLASIFILINPYYVNHLGFQLSFGISFLLCLFPYKSIIVWLYTLPLLSAHFFYISVAPLIVVKPLVWIMQTIIFPLTWLIIIFKWLIPLEVIWKNIEQIFICFVDIIRFLSEQKWWIWVTGRQPDHYYIALILSVFIFGYIWCYMNKHYLACIVLLPIFFLFIPVYREQVLFIDVGQGNSALIQKGESALLIDTGGELILPVKEQWRQKERQSFAKRVLQPVLWAQGIKQLEGVVLTHADSDHSGALEDLKMMVPIQTIYYGKGAKINGNRAITGHNTIYLRSFSIDVLYPMEAGEGKNDDSLILYGKYLGKTFLFMGDASVKIEKELLKKYPNLRTDILVVGHHGSQTSSDKNFIQAIQSTWSIISVGRKNKYGHPHHNVLENLKRTYILRTDQHGAVSFSQQNSRLQIETMLVQN